MRPNLSLGDTLAGLHAVLGILLAYVSAASRQAATGRWWTWPFTNRCSNMLEAVVPEYDGAGLAGAATLRLDPDRPSCRPTPTPAATGAYVVIGGNGNPSSND